MFHFIIKFYIKFYFGPSFYCDHLKRNLNVIQYTQRVTPLREMKFEYWNEDISIHKDAIFRAHPHSERIEIWKYESAG